MIGIVKYNPKWGITIGVVENIIALFLMIVYRNSIINIFLFCFINFFIKIVPLWTLRKTKYNIRGIYSTIILFFIYLLWVMINNVPFKNIYEWIKKNKDPGPFTYYAKKLLNI